MGQFLMRLFRFLGWVYAAYLSVVLLFVLSFTYLIPAYHADKGNFSSDYRAAFEQRDAQVLILGSSRAAAALDSELLTQKLGLQAYNLAFNQANISYNYDLMRAYLDRCEQVPKYVILDVSWFSFDNRRLAYKEYAANFIYRHPHLYWADLLLNRNRPLVNGALSAARALERLNRTDLNFDSNRSRYADQDSLVKSYDFDPMDDGFLKTFPRGRAKIDSDELEAFEKLMALLSERGIEPVLVTTPEDVLFSQSQQNRDEVYLIIRNKADQDIWMDYSPEGNLYSKDFELLLRDSHHIHFKDSFTQIFAEDFENRVLRPN
jgi:hypothetical protein